MIIKELKIKNFRSYYGDQNIFQFSDRLTLILGDSGDGKTTFFEALQWLFNTVIDKGSLDNVSEMRKSKLEIGEKDEVCVSLSFNHDGDKFVEKSFSFERTGENTFKVGSLVYRGYETNGIEREQVGGKELIQSCYDAFIQRFSMFKGESELNVFNNPQALKDLVNKFSDIRRFDDLVKMTSVLEEKSNSAYLKEIKSDNKVSKEAKSLEYKLSGVTEKIEQWKSEIKDKTSSLNIYSQKLEELEHNQETSERYKDIEDRRKTQEEKKNRLLGQIGSVDYNTALLDKYWILCAFPKILQEFQQKCSALSKEKRKQEKEFDIERAEELGKLKAIKTIQGSLINGSTELPWYLPDQETMEEMLHDQICKVCGRPAPEGSEAYHFMMHKLNEYKDHIKAKLDAELKKEALENQSLFKQEQIESLHNLSISLSGSNESFVSGIATEISERQDLVSNLRLQLKNVKEKIQDIMDEKSRLLIQAGNVSEDILMKNFADIKGLFQQKGNAERRLSELKSELTTFEAQYRSLKMELDQLNPSSSQVRVYRDVHHVLEEIAKAFSNARKDNLRRFLDELTERANNYLETLSPKDFHGEIRLIRTADDSTEIKLFSSNGSEVKKPSGSQKTEMYISILFAISDFTQEKREEDYPLIFDAATSSFGDTKSQDFYNVIDKLNKQCIIVTKDFMTKGIVKEKEIEELSCPVYRIKKADGFDRTDMSTVRTIIKKIKD